MEYKTSKLGLRFPFDIIDFFGYLFPGFTLILCVLLFESEIKGNYKHNGYVFEVFVKTFHYLRDQTVAYELFIIFAVFTTIYIIGHIVSATSSFFIDHVFVYKIYGFPYEFLLDLQPHKAGDPEQESKAKYKGIFTWLNGISLGLFVLVFTVESFFASALILLIAIGFALIDIYYLRLATKIYDVITTRIAEYIRTRKSLHPEFIRRYIQAFTNNFGLEVSLNATYNYWLPYLFIIDKSSLISPFITHFLRLFGFARNLATALHIAFVYCLISLFYYKFALNITFSIAPFSDPKIRILIIPLIYFILSFLIMIRYYYIYVYYTKFILRSFVYLNSSKNPL